MFGLHVDPAADAVKVLIGIGTATTVSGVVEDGGTVVEAEEAVTEAFAVELDADSCCCKVRHR